MLRVFLLTICTAAALLSNHSLAVSPLYLINFALLALLLFSPANHINNIVRSLSHISPISTLFVLTLWFALSQLWSQAVSATQTFFYTFDLILLAALVSSTLTAKQQRSIYQLLLAIGVMIALYTLFLTVTQGVLFPQTFFVHKNNYAGFLLLLLLPAAALMMSARTTFLVHVLGLVCAILATALTTTQSRGAFLGFVIGLFTLAYLYKQRRYFFHLLSWLASGLIAALLISPASNSLATKLVSTISNVSHHPTAPQAINPRIDIWASALEMYKQFPFSGWGGGTFKIAYPAFRPAEFFPTIYNAHNDYLHMLVELGPVGLIALLALVGAVLQRGIKFSGSDNSRQSALHSGITAALTALFCQMLFTSSLYAAPLGIIAGIYIGGLSRAEEGGGLPRLKPMNILLKGMIAFLLLQLSGITISEYFIQKSHTAPTADARLALLEMAGRWYPANDAPHYLQAQLVADLIAQGISVTPKALKAALTELDRAQSLLPLRRQTYWLRAHLLHHLTPVPYRDIEQNYSQALSLNPKFLRARVEYAAVIKEQGDTGRSCSVLEQGLNEQYYTRRTTLLEYTRRLQLCRQGAYLKTSFDPDKHLRKLRNNHFDIIFYHFNS